MFVWTGDPKKIPANFQQTCEDPNWVEVWNDVFMQYNKTAEGEFEPLQQKNVDTGMGLERMLAVMNGTDDNYRTDLFWTIIQKIEELSGLKYGDKTDEEHLLTDGQCWIDVRKKMRIVADHLKAAVFAISDGVIPSNKGTGYVVRRLIRRAIVKAHQLEIKENFTLQIADVVFAIYNSSYPELIPGSQTIKSELEKEEIKFRKTMNIAFREFDVMSKMWTGKLNEKGDLVWEKQEAVARDLFNLYQSYGLPIEISLEEMRRRNIPVKDESKGQAYTMLKIVVEDSIKQHQELSRTASAGMFKGGLSDAGEMATKYHTATHLLLAALRKVLGDHVFQKGSNINVERLRFDFSHAEKMTSEQIQQVEDLVNDQIQKNLPVKLEEMPLEKAKETGAMGVFDSKYGENVKVYTIGDFSKEICGGPHVQKTSELGKFKIKKEESSSSGVRRIKAVLE
jgi:alanyl-tRNA synthetase